MNILKEKTLFICMSFFIKLAKQHTIDYQSKQKIEKA